MSNSTRICIRSSFGRVRRRALDVFLLKVRDIGLGGMGRFTVVEGNEGSLYEML